ncbi:MAG: hypothetical protein WDN45_08195 [Caulobacteraceae bacterium]
MRHLGKTAAASALLLVLGGAGGVLAQDSFKADPKASFFVTSVGSGKGADLGGLAGADSHCADLAKAAGITGKTWKAYLSTSTVNARDRIGKGPWYNVKGVLVASSIDDLHSPNNKLNKENSLTERGGTVNGIGDTPNTHDMLTGTNEQGALQQPLPIPPPPGAPAGTAPSPPPENMTCNNWTSSVSGGAARAMLGHLDRKGAGATGPSWVAAHASRGCSQPELVVSGGAGLYYCFAAS